MTAFKRNIKSGIVVLLFICFLFACSNKNNKKNNHLVVYAASSLTNFVSELANSFYNTHKIKVKINAGSSGTLVRQITQGGNPDIYLSANKQWVNYTDSLGFVFQNNKKGFAKGNLVLISAKSNKTDSIKIDSISLYNLLKNSRIAMGDPKHVPAGKYAYEALQYFKCNTKLKSNIIPTKDVRSALMLVELGEAKYGMVYKTDAIKSEKVKIIATFPESSHSIVEYYAALCSSKKESKLFYDYLDSENAKTILYKFGFLN